MKVQGPGSSGPTGLRARHCEEPRRWQFDFAHCPELVEGRDD
jgi:hypothetical protein